MRHKLFLGKFDSDKIIATMLEKAIMIQNNGYKGSQIWQSEEDYDTVGFNFSRDNEPHEVVILSKEGNILLLEMDVEYEVDTAKELISLYNKIS